MTLTVEQSIKALSGAALGAEEPEVCPSVQKASRSTYDGTRGRDGLRCFCTAGCTAGSSAVRGSSHAEGALASCPGDMVGATAQLVGWPPGAPCVSYRSACRAVSYFCTVSRPRSSYEVIRTWADMGSSYSRTGSSIYTKTVVGHS